MNSSEFRKRGREAIDFIADYLESIEKRRVLPEVQPGYLKDLLPDHPPDEPELWDDIMKDFNEAILPGVGLDFIELKLTTLSINL